MKGVSKHMTSVVFAICSLVSLLSIALVLLLSDLLLLLLALSLVSNVWALVVSERHGFVKTNQIRRAFEPERHFNAGQVLIIVVLIMTQIGTTAYVLLT